MLSIVCFVIKADLVEKCHAAGKNDAIVRIVCRELESWYLGDLAAVERGLGLRNLAKQQQSSKYRAPDNLANPKQELLHITNTRYQNVRHSRAIGKELSLDANRSHSFSVFIAAMHRLII